MAVIAGEECHGAHGILIICDGDKDIPECESLGPSEVPCSKRPRTFSDDPSKCQNVAYINVDVIDNYPLSNSDLDVRKGKLDTPKASDEKFPDSTYEYSLTHFRRALQKKISLQGGERFMQFLMNTTVELPKFIPRDKCVTERVFDTPTSRSRKYKRSVSFNSRRVGLLFSVLSIMGTMILIYLTIRVKQIGEASANL